MSITDSESYTNQLVKYNKKFVVLIWIPAILQMQENISLNLSIFLANSLFSRIKTPTIHPFTVSLLSFIPHLVSIVRLNLSVDYQG